MVYEYTTYRLANQDISAGNNDLQQIFIAGELTLYCTLHFDTDEISDTYNHWICCLEIVSDTEDVPQRSITLYPNTLHFEGDTRFVVSITSELDYIGHDDLQNAYITIGVPVNE
jgi:hypothetical protein